MFEKQEETEAGHGFGMVEVKRFFQWILGCTYAKKTFRTRMAEMFHFADAPHIVVYERSEERPWYWMVGIITAVLVAVLSLYYTLEAGVRAVRKFMYSVLREPPQSTVSTPRCLSPTTPSSKKTSPQIPITSEAPRQKVPMNEPVNCVFIRPAIPKLSAEGTVPIPNMNSEEDTMVDADRVMTSKNEKDKEKRDKTKSPPSMKLEEVKFDASSNVNIIPTMVPSPSVSSKKSNRKSTGSEEKEAAPEASVSEGGHMDEWLTKQVAGCEKLIAERANAGEEIDFEETGAQMVSNGFIEKIQQLIEAQLEQSSCLEDSSNSVLSMESIISSLIEIEPSFEDTQSNSPLSEVTDEKPTFKQSTVRAMATVSSVCENDDVDIVIDDNSLYTDKENECAGSILVQEGQQKVLFRWTDECPNTIDTVTLTGSFFGWNMNIPMKRTGVTTFEVSIDLPAGLHDYLINIFRFD
ncbi:hypothetical protein CRE_04411 [Caenorhabditis remanei]|uniref:AMP-activated protein kinase glycogen-binding domain-containing protein n=1 Tax=Caenorhabditis remanei TaxID=31234 RepID=E3NMC6_CAERE|nr:hypothetical protein CRE_04411 [Caenorhabditis remanei]